MIFNSSLISGVFPHVWYIAKKDFFNYWPISVISVFSRILEEIVHDLLIEFLAANKVITRS